MKITYKTLLTMVNANEQPKKIKVGTATYTWNGCDYILNTDSRKSLSDTLTNWTTKAQTNAEFIEVVEDVLTGDEKEYLSAVIKPFREWFEYIIKVSSNDHTYEWVCIQLKSDCIDFPPFEADSMYKGLMIDKRYTLEELDL